MKKHNALELHTFENLTLYKWDRFLATNDSNWFRIEFDGREKKLSEDILKPCKEQMIEEYAKYVNDPSFSNKLSVWKKIDDLRTKYNVVGSLLDRMYLGFADFQMDIRLAIVLELKKWGFRIPEINTLKEDFELIKTYRNALEGIKTQIEILKKEVIEEAKEDTRNLYDDLITVSRALQLGYRINPKDTLLPEWLSMCKRLKEISKQN